jgi:hypothetical protein
MSAAATIRRPKLHPHVREYAKILGVPVAQIVQLIRGRCQDAGLVIRFRVIRHQQSRPIPLKQLLPSRATSNHEKNSPEKPSGRN